MSDNSAAEPGAAQPAGESAPLPTQAELDAIDMAEIAARRPSAGDPHTRRADPGPPPASLRHALWAWIAATTAALVCMIWGFATLGTITDELRDRLRDGVINDPHNAAPAHDVDSIASFFPPFLLVLIAVAVAVQYPLLRAITTRCSRGARNTYATMVVLTLVSIPIGADLLFDYPRVNAVTVWLSWIDFALLALSGLLVFRRSVNAWLPAPMRLRPHRAGR